MNHGTGVRIMMVTGGLLTALIGIGHIFMPDFGYGAQISESMSPAVREHFYYLGTYAVCLFLLSFAVLSLYFSKFTHPKATVVVCGVLCTFWIGRSTLELVYPVNVKIFFLDKPHAALLPVALSLAAIYLISSIKSWYLTKLAR